MRKEKHCKSVHLNYIKDLRLDSLSHSSDIQILIKSNTPSLHNSNTPANSKEYLQTDPLHPSAVEATF
jgi:hypothetical protein